MCALGSYQAVLGWSPFSKEDFRRKVSASSMTSNKNRPGGEFPTAFCGFLGYQADTGLANEARAVHQTLQNDH